jgi:NaMN:DMB phosphoribosyltransferase
MIQTLTGDIEFIESLRGKKATLLLALSNTKTANIEASEGSSQNYLTPTISSEFICTGQIKSMDIDPQELSNSTHLTRYIHTKTPFGRIELLDLGLETKPKLNYFTLHDFEIPISQNIAKGANIDAQAIFEKGINFGQSYQCKDEYIILAESIPSGTLTAMTTSLALRYKNKEDFSASSESKTENLLKLALSNIDEKDDLFAVLSKVSDNILIFNAGFILGLNNSIPILLAGDTHMASLLLIINRILKLMGGVMETSNLALCTTKEVAEDCNSNIKNILETPLFAINSYYIDFELTDSKSQNLSSSSGALIYGILNGLDRENISQKI